jgi:16S rRNA (cytidine1402-2'-O)-methyltransferase
MQDFLKPSQENIKDNFFLDSALYVVSTPIGNIQDITLRAIETLKKCDTIICEDSRISMRLLKFLNIKKPLIIYNDHSDDYLRGKILDLIKTQNKSLCLISDAGTPLISDPGYKLVDFLLSNSVLIKSVPGACSAIAALSISGVQSDRFLFAGFVPNAKSQREIFLKDLVNINSTLILFESPHRLISTLKSMLEIFGNRKAAIAREITKFYEELKRNSIEELIEYYEKSKIKGEIVILLSKANPKDQKDDFKQIDQDLKLALQTMKPKDAISIVSQNYNLSKKIIYQRVLDGFPQTEKNN